MNPNRRGQAARSLSSKTLEKISAVPPPIFPKTFPPPTKRPAVPLTPCARSSPPILPAPSRRPLRDRSLCRKHRQSFLPRSSSENITRVFPDPPADGWHQRQTNRPQRLPLALHPASSRVRVCLFVFRAECLRKLRAAGLEPARPCGHWILSPMRLPFRHAREQDDLCRTVAKRRDQRAQKAAASESETASA